MTPYGTEDAADHAPSALLPMLELAVPLRILELQAELNRLGSEEGGMYLLRLAHEAAEHNAAHGDNLLFGGKRKGEAAAAFNALVTCLAVGSFAPGGITFAGLHFETPSGEST